MSLILKGLSGAALAGAMPPHRPWSRPARRRGRWRGMLRHRHDRPERLRRRARMPAPAIRRSTMTANPSSSVPAGTCVTMETPLGPGSLEPIQRPELKNGPTLFCLHPRGRGAPTKEEHDHVARIEDPDDLRPCRHRHRGHGKLCRRRRARRHQGHVATGDFEMCYGVALKGQNDCGAGAHSCAGMSTVDYDPASFKLVAKGTCTTMTTPNGMGMLEPM